jgi:hypothetical protein
MDSILFFLSGGDLTKIPLIKKSRVGDFRNFYYQKRLEALNSLLDSVARLKDIKSKEKKQPR